MNEALLACPNCTAPLPGAPQELTRLQRCLECGAGLEAHVFPALFRQVQIGAHAAAIVAADEAGCFYHPRKRAVAPCDGCGRFLCALCDIELGGGHLCPACLDAGKKSGRLSGLENRRTLYDSAALTLAMVPMLLWPLTLITAPAVLCLVFFRWNAPGGVVARSKVRYVVALMIALLQLAGWGTVLWMLLNR